MLISLSMPLLFFPGALATGSASTRGMYSLLLLRGGCTTDLNSLTSSPKCNGGGVLLDGKPAPTPCATVPPPPPIPPAPAMLRDAAAVLTSSPPLKSLRMKWGEGAVNPTPLDFPLSPSLSLSLSLILSAGGGTRVGGVVAPGERKPAPRLPPCWWYSLEKKPLSGLVAPIPSSLFSTHAARSDKGIDALPTAMPATISCAKAASPVAASPGPPPPPSVLALLLSPLSREGFFLSVGMGGTMLAA